MAQPVTLRATMDCWALVWDVSLGTTRQTSTRANAPSSTGHLATAATAVTTVQPPPLASTRPHVRLRTGRPSRSMQVTRVAPDKPMPSFMHRRRVLAVVSPTSGSMFTMAGRLDPAASPVAGGSQVRVGATSPHAGIAAGEIAASRRDRRRSRRRHPTQLPRPRQRHGAGQRDEFDRRTGRSISRALPIRANKWPTRLGRVRTFERRQPPEAGASQGGQQRRARRWTSRMPASSTAAAR